MDFKKLAPWNWFKNEEEEAGGTVPVQRGKTVLSAFDSSALRPVAHMRHEMDRLFDNFFSGSGATPFSSDLFTPLAASNLLKPKVDVGATGREYSITVEVPGVRQEDVKIEIANNTMTISGEKKQEQEEKDKNYYRVERFYGSFQRVLSLPEDADQEQVQATFKNGVLTVRMPRKTLPQSDVKRIEIKNME